MARLSSKSTVADAEQFILAALDARIGILLWSSEPRITISRLNLARRKLVGDKLAIRPIQVDGANVAIIKVNGGEAIHGSRSDEHALRELSGEQS